MSASSVNLTVGASAGLVSAATGGSAIPAVVQNLIITNNHASQTVCVSFGGETPVVGGAGHFIPASGTLILPVNISIPTGGMKIIASGATTPVTFSWFSQ